MYSNLRIVIIEILNILDGQNFLFSLISEEFFNQSLQSYFGILNHCQGYKIRNRIKEALKVLGKT